MQAPKSKSVSNDVARFLGVAVKRLESEIKFIAPLWRWFIGEDQNHIQTRPPTPRQMGSSSVASPVVTQTFQVKEKAAYQKSVESVRQSSYDNKSAEIKSGILFDDLRSADRSIRQMAQEELKNIPRSEVFNLLERVFAAEGDALRVIENLNVLETLRDESPIVRQIFNKYAGHEDCAVRLAALGAIAKYRDDAGFERVSGQLKDKDPEVRRRVLNYLCWNYEERCLSSALAAFHDADNRIRKTAVLIVGSLKAPEAITGLLTLLTDPDPAVQENANSSLKKITGNDFGFNALALRAHKDEAVNVWKQWWMENQTTFGRPKSNGSTEN